MAKSFKDLAARTRETWSEDTQTVYEAASAVFQEEVRAQLRVGQQLAAARHERGLTQPALAAATGINQAEISRIETGNANPTLETVSRMATALDKTFQLEPASAASH